MSRYQVLTGNNDSVTIGNDGGVVMADAGDDTITGGDARDIIQVAVAAIPFLAEVTVI